MDYQYDLFISFKNSTENGLTEDREVAEMVFEELTQNDFKVFFSNKVLSDRGIANYMLEIQNALEGARAILVIYSCAEYISQGWVAQEWMTFLNLLMKDSNRKIYVYSIGNDLSGLPPFLRPYECFGDYKLAINHLINGMRGKEKIKNGEIGKRNFLNAYWGLFGNTDINDYLNKSMKDIFYNYKVYCIRSEFLSGGNVKTYINGLKSVLESEKNPLAAYLLSRHYRDVRYLDLKYSKDLVWYAFKSFQYKIHNSSGDSEIGLWIMTNQEEYDGAFYMCDIIHDVLDAYEVKTDIKILSSDNLSKIDFESRKRIVLFWSNVCMDIPECFIEELKLHKEQILIGLNSFGEDALPYDIRACKVFENNNKDITKVCRILLS